MEIIEQLENKYNAIQFISVNLDENENSFADFLRKPNISGKLEGHKILKM